MEPYDAIIIGAGPIGCYTAQQIAQQNHRVALIEEHQEIGRPLQCAGLVTERVFELVKLPQTYIVQNKIYGAHVHSPAGHTLTIGGDKIHALVIDRTCFDQELAKHACNAGAEFFLASRATAIQKQPTEITVDIKQKDNNRQLNSKVLIGADGPHSTVRTLFKFPQPTEFLRGIGAEVTNVSLDPRYVEIFLGHNLAPGFFAWIIPTNTQGTEARVGLCCDNTATPKHCFATFFKQLQLKEAVITTRIAGTIPLGPLKKTVRGSILLVGDAAAQIKPTSGGGIYPGLLSSTHAATTVNEALQENPINLQRLKTYHTKWTRDIGKELSLGMRFRKIYQRLTDEQFDNYVQKFNDEKTLEIINTYGDIDYPSKLAFPLFKAAPSLLKFLPSLLRRKP